MIRLGTALKSQEPPFHRCLVISDPETSGGQIVLVRVTTNDGTWPDGDCILTPADWGELEHESTVAYSTCKFGPAAKALEAAIQRGLFQEISQPPVAVLRRVILAAHSSAGMPPGAKKWLGKI
jgi:hypothetical protein